jgi:hypothetical protein
LTGNRGFLKSIGLNLQFHSHAAQKTGVALPDGQATGDWRVLQCFRKRGFHVLPAKKKHYFAAFVKGIFCVEKTALLKACRRDGRW